MVLEKYPLLRKSLGKRQDRMLRSLMEKMEMLTT